MKRRNWLVFLLPLIVSACASLTDPEKQYQGPNPGYLVIGIGQTPAPSLYDDYFLKYRPQDQSNAGAGVGYIKHNLLMRRPADFDGPHGAGIVEVVALQPGNYEFYSTEVLRTRFNAITTYKLKHDFSIPFTITGGQAVYAGHFMAKNAYGKGAFGLAIPDGATFLISDQETADLAIARTPRANVTSLPNAITTVVDITPDPRLLNIPVFLPDSTAP